MEPHISMQGGGMSGVGPLDGVSLQQTAQMQEYKYQEHIKKLDDKWMRMKEELEKMTKGTFCHFTHQ